MGFFDNLLRGAQQTAGNAVGVGKNLVKQAVNADIPMIDTAALSRGKIQNSPISLSDFSHNVAPATTTAVLPTIKTSADLVGTVGGWIPGQTGKNIKLNQQQTDDALNGWMHDAHKQLGIDDKDLLVQTANIIPKIAGFAAGMDTGASEGLMASKIAASFAKAGIGAKALESLNMVADTSPATARMLTNYIMHPETDINLFKAALNPKAAGATIRLAQGAGAAVGGTAGYNMVDGALKGKNPGEIAKSTVEGLPTGVANEFGIEGFKQAIPYVAKFLHDAHGATDDAVRSKLQEVGEHFISKVHTEEPVQPGLPTHPEGTQVSEMSPAHLNAVQQAKAEQDMNLIHANEIVRKAREAEAPAEPPLDQNMINANRTLRAQQMAAESSTNRMQPAGGMFDGYMAKLKARQAEFKATQAELDTKYQPSEQELAQMNRNAEATPAPKTVSVKMAPNETGSAQENQGATPKPVALTNQQKAKQIIDEVLSKPQPKPNPEGTPTIMNEKPASPRESQPALVHREYDESGKVTSMTHTGTGEKFSMSHDGSPLSNLKNELLHETKGEAYGKSGRDVARVHGDATGGRLGVLRHRIEAVVNHVKSNFNTEEREQLTHYVEGSLKPTEVSAKIRQIGDQWKEIERIGYLHNKEASRTMGEIDNGMVSHVEHIALDRPKGGKVGLGKFSTKNSTQQGRSIIKLSKGKDVQFGNPEAMGMTKMGNGTYQDKFGNTWHPSQATIKELNENGRRYETDAAKIMASSFNKYAKTANNLKLGRNLLGKGHGENIIPRQPGETVPPKGYVESHIPGLHDVWMSKAYHDHLYTATDVQKNLAYKGVELVGKGVGVVTRGINNAFFTLAPHFHAMVNEMPQALTTFGAGKGPLSAAKTGTMIGSTMKSMKARDEDFFNWMREGGSLSHGSDGGIERHIDSAWGKIKDAGARMNLPLRLGHALTEQVGTTIRYAKARQLVQDEGMSMREAIRTVNKLQGDYGNLNRFEKEVVKNYVQFYPFFKHQITSLTTVSLGAIKNPKVYAGSAAMAAMTYAGYVALNKALEGATGNKYAELRKGGMLGLVDDAMKAKGQVEGYTDKAGNKHPGIVPSIVANRLNPVERQAIEQGTGKDLGTNKPFNTDQNGRVAQAGKSVAEVQNYTNASTGKKSAAEEALNANGVKLPHSMNTPAAPNLRGTTIGDLINVSGHDAKQTIDTASLVKKSGGDKLTAMQVMRLNGDDSLSKFWGEHPELDPKNPKFQGFKNNGPNISAGKDAFKEAGGSSLTYMQALKMSGSTTYDKFFQAHPELDPTNPGFKGMAKSSGGGKKLNLSGQIKYSNTSGKIGVSKAKRLAHPIGLKHTSGIKIAKAKPVKLKLKAKA